MKIGISPAEATHLVSQQSAATDQIRNQLRTIGNFVDSLASASYVSSTTQACRAKFYGDTLQQFEKVLARAENAQAGTIKAMQTQQQNQDSGASAVNAC